MRALLLAVAMLMALESLSAQELNRVIVGTDTLEYRYTPIDQTSHTQTGIERFGLRLNSYFTLAENDPRRVKFSVVGAPAYSENTGLRLNALAMMNYRTLGVSAPHRLSLRGMASLKGCYDVAIDGVNYLGSKSHQFAYGADFGVERTYIYGLDYAESLTANRGLYRARSYGAYLHYTYKVTEWLTVGILTDYVNSRVLSVDNRADEILGSMLYSFWGVGIGVDVTCSSRRVEDVNLVRGVYFQTKYKAYPQGMSSCSSICYELSMTFDYYQPLWRGGLLAMDAYGEYHSANTPWLLRATVGGDNRMRGYYRGRFNGDALVALQLELRQRVWEGLVVAGWGGCGAAFGPNDPAAWSKVLPTYGAGVRWYFNPTSLVRIDYGFGRNSRALVVGYSEAF